MFYMFYFGELEKMPTAYGASPDLCRSMDTRTEVPGASKFVKHLVYDFRD